jgi:LuxR family maltose regulon positive regulatory protein
MTLSQVARPLTNGDPTPHPSDAPTWGWAVVEIRRDGTWGSPRVVPATGLVEAASAAFATSAEGARLLPALSSDLHAEVGSVQAWEGDLHLAAAAFTRGVRADASSPGRLDCLGRLAHVVAMQGDLRRASGLAAMVPSPGTRSAGPGSDHAQMARAWIALERTDFSETRRLLGLLNGLEGLEHDRWLAASVLLVQAQLLIATGEPDTARRLLAGACEARVHAEWSEWFTELLTIARSEALLASGEAQRSLATLTPMPVRASAAASVLAATVRHSIGDARGARSVLGTAMADLDHEPLALQIHAWLLESRLAEDRGEHDRADVVLDRALHAAASEEMRRPLLRDWAWIRRRVDRDPALLRAHRDFLSTCETSGPAPRLRTDPVRSDGLLGAPLTDREAQVLDLLAQMYSTEEIASALYVSSNTVKTHLKGIFGKLCVNRRVDAVRRGRQLGLC